MATAELVRWRLDPLASDRRVFGERLLPLTSGLVRRLSAALLRLPAGSRLRKAGISRELKRGIAAGNRGDYESQFAMCSPDVEFHMDYRDWVSVDLDPVYRGHAELRRLMDDMRSVWSEFRIQPREVVDAGGGRMACRVEVRGVGRQSGIGQAQEQWYALIMERGLLVRQHVVKTEDEALAALRTRY
jgi:ketosteroid isomerase-like protein